MLQKLLLTSVVIFVDPGTPSQITFCIFVCFVMLLLLTHYSPYVNNDDDLLSWVTILGND